MHPSIEMNLDDDTDDSQDVVGEGTRLLPLPSTPSPTNRPIITNSTPSSSSSSTKDHARHILLSTTLTKLGSRTWEFATPLLLLEWSPGSLAAPATLGLECTLFRTIVSPLLGRLADQRWDRLNAVLVGTAMQAVGCLVSVGALLVWNALLSNKSGSGNDDNSSAMIRILSLVLVIIAGVIEALGAQLASVAVKKEWVPIVFDEDSNNCKQRQQKRLDNDASYNEAEVAAASAEERSTIFSFLDILPTPITLSYINTAMTNIDLLAAMFGPVLAGWILQVLGGGGGGGGGGESIQRGFAMIAVMNVISFVPEMILLRRVYWSCPALRQSRGGGGGGGGGDDNGDGLEERKESEQPDANVDNKIEQHNKSNIDEPNNPWTIWFHHPSGLPLLTLSLASLYMTALSSNGVVLTAYLVAIGLSPTAIGIFRGMGSFSGVVGICLFSLVRKCGDDVVKSGTKEEEDEAERTASMRSIERLRRISLAFLLLEVVSVLVAAVAHSLCETSHLISSAVSSSSSFATDTTDTSIPWQITLFLGAIIVSRAGLYSFDIGVLEIEQYVVDERYRNAVGSVEGALCSLAEMGMYVLSIALPNPSQFGWQVGVSASAVSFGGVCFGVFLCLYHMHRHHHHHHDHEGDCDDGHDHHHHHHHAHTFQQEKDLREYGYHVHLHRHMR